MAIDRRGGPTIARETVELAKEFFLSTENTVLGLDLSGDPTVSYYIFSATGRISQWGEGQFGASYHAFVSSRHQMKPCSALDRQNT
jgi:hypothetical protein